MTSVTREDALNLLARSDKAVISFLIGMFERQTADEQDAETTGHDNGVGFNGTDAGILSSFAKQAMANRAKRYAGDPSAYPTDLSPKQVAVARKKLAKYGRQLTEILAAKVAEKEETGVWTFRREAEVRPLIGGNDEDHLLTQDYLARQGDYPEVVQAEIEETPWGPRPTAVQYTPLPEHLRRVEVREEVDLASGPFRCCSLVREGETLRWPTARELWENGGRDEFNTGVDRWFKDREGVTVGGSPSCHDPSDPFGGTRLG